MLAASILTVLIVAVFAVLAFAGIMMTAGMRFHRRRKDPWSDRHYEEPREEP